MNKEQANQELAEKSLQILNLLKEMENIADEHSLTFSLSFADPCNVNRSIGGEYYGKGFKDHWGFYTGGWDSSANVEEGEPLKEGLWEAWQSSSEMC